MQCRHSIHQKSVVCLSNAMVTVFGKMREFGSPTNAFDFDIVNFPFLDRDVPRSTSNGVYICRLIPFVMPRH